MHLLSLFRRSIANIEVGLSSKSVSYYTLENMQIIGLGRCVRRIMTVPFGVGAYRLLVIVLVAPSAIYWSTHHTRQSRFFNVPSV